MPLTLRWVVTLFLINQRKQIFGRAVWIDCPRPNGNWELPFRVDMTRSPSRPRPTSLWTLRTAGVEVFRPTGIDVKRSCPGQAVKGDCVLMDNSLLRLRRRKPNLINDPDHARNLARVGLGACALIWPIDHAGHRHPAVFDFDLQPVARDRQVPMQRV